MAPTALRTVSYLAIIAVAINSAVMLQEKEKIHNKAGAKPTKLVYGTVGLRIASDAGYFTKESFAAIQYTNHKPLLNWVATLEKEIPETVQIRLVVRRLERNQCSKMVYDSGLISFCNSPPAKVQSYAKILGFSASDPPVVKCPFKPATYKLLDFSIDKSQLDENIDKGDLVLDYLFVVDGQPIISYYVFATVS